MALIVYPNEVTTGIACFLIATVFKNSVAVILSNASFSDRTGKQLGTLNVGISPAANLTAIEKGYKANRGLPTATDVLA